MLKTTVVLVLFMTSFFPQVSHCRSRQRYQSNATHIERLHDRLLRVYDKTRVPVNRRTGQSVNVTVYMWPYDILYVKEAQGAIKISGWIDMRWQDPQLTWNPLEYGGMNETFIVRDKLWLPEIDIFYRSEDSTRKDDTPMAQACKHCPVYVKSDGRVLRGYYFAYSFPCKVNVKYFPFDQHNCSMQLANWHMDDRYMDLYPENTSVDLSIFLPNEEWDLKAMTVTRTRDYYNYGHFPILTYTLNIERKPFYYVCNLVVPTIILTMTALIGYHMPSAGNGMHQEKVKMGLTTILSIFILQLGVSDKLPRTSDVVPLIAVFYSCMVGLLSLAIVATSLVIVIEKQGIYEQPVPSILIRVFMLESPLMPYQTHDDYGMQQHQKCRLLDCGCRLKSKDSYTLLCSTNPAPPSAVSNNTHGTMVVMGMNNPGVTSPIGSPAPNPRSGGILTNRANRGGGASPSADRRKNRKASRNDTTFTNTHETSATPHTHQYNNPNTANNPPLNCTAASGIQLMHAILMEALNDLRIVNAVNRDDALRELEAHRIRMQWMRLADRVENLSLAAFVAGCALSVALFFNHGWY